MYLIALDMRIHDLKDFGSTKNLTRVIDLRVVKFLTARRSITFARQIGFQNYFFYLIDFGHSYQDNKLFVQSVVICLRRWPPRSRLRGGQCFSQKYTNVKKKGFRRSLRPIAIRRQKKFIRRVYNVEDIDLRAVRFSTTRRSITPEPSLFLRNGHLFHVRDEKGYQIDAFPGHLLSGWFSEKASILMDAFYGTPYIILYLEWKLGCKQLTFQL